MSYTTLELRREAVQSYNSLSEDVKRLVNEASVLSHIFDGDALIIGLPHSELPNGHPAINAMDADDKTRHCFYAAHSVICKCLESYLRHRIIALLEYPPINRVASNVDILNQHMAKVKTVHDRLMTAENQSRTFRFSDDFFRWDGQEISELNAILTHVETDYASAIGELDKSEQELVRWRGRELLVLGLAIGAIATQIFFCSCSLWRQLPGVTLPLPQVHQKK